MREVCGGNIGSLYIHVLNLVHNTGKLLAAEINKKWIVNEVKTD